MRKVEIRHSHSLDLESELTKETYIISGHFEGPVEVRES